MKSLRRVLPATLILVPAMIFAASGGAVAAKLITSKDIKNETITSADVKNGSLGAQDLSAAAKATLKGAKGATGPQGPKGAPGATGAAGPAGQPGQDGAAGGLGELVQDFVVTPVEADTDDFIAELYCPEGYVLSSAFGFYAQTNDALQVSIADEGVTGAVAYGLPTGVAQNAVLQITCAEGSVQELPAPRGAKSGFKTR